VVNRITSDRPHRVPGPSYRTIFRTVLWYRHFQIVLIGLRRENFSLKRVLDATVVRIQPRNGRLVESYSASSIEFCPIPSTHLSREVGHLEAMIGTGFTGAGSATMTKGRLAQRLEHPVYTRKVLRSNRRSPTIRHAWRGDVVQLVRTLPCHGRGREFESRRPRHTFDRSSE
jgi:hypothetical protein